MISSETLRRFPLFGGIAPDALSDIALMANETFVREGEWLFGEKDPADAIYLILDGAIELKINLDEAGSRHGDLDRLGRGDLVGWSALIETAVFTLGAKALTGVRLVEIDATQLRPYLDTHPETGYILMRRLAEEIGLRLTNLRIQFVSMITTA